MRLSDWLPRRLRCLCRPVSNVRRFPRAWHCELLEDRTLLSGTSLLQAPLHFEPNVGQTGADVQFLARGQGYNLYLTPGEAVLNLFDSSDSRPDVLLTAQVVGADLSSQPVGLDLQTGISNYYLGSDPSQWHTNVPHYAQVKYAGVYPGVDLVYYGTDQRQLEYDFVVAPGADPHAIRVAYQGADRIGLDADGNLVLHTAGGDVVQHAPIIYQDVNGVRTPVHGSFALYPQGDQLTVGFDVGTYDSSLPLVIDPVLVYSTYLGGSGVDQVLDVAVGMQGTAYNESVYVTGFTRSSNFPLNTPTLDNSLGGSSDAFVTRLNPNGTVNFSTYFGGSARENDLTGFGGYGGIDHLSNSGNRTGIFLTGFTQSSDFPTTTGAFQRNLNGSQDAFVVRIDNNGGTLNYSTLLGGSGAEAGADITVDPNGNAYVTGWTDSSNFPTTSGVYQSTRRGGLEAFVAKLPLSGTSLTYSTYLGGTGDDTPLGIGIDSIGNVIITGRTRSSDLPTTPNMDRTLGGNSDAFVSKLNPTGTTLLFSTYLGGSGDEDLDPAHGLAVGGLAVDSSGNVFVTGSTSSSNLSLVGPFDTSLNGTWDAFVFKLDSSGNTVYSTYLGGSGNDIGTAIAFNTAGNAFVTGYTESSDYPVFNPTQSSLAGTRDSFLSVLNPGGFALVNSTYLGGSGGSEGDIARAIAVDARDNAYVVGFTDSSSYPTQSAAQSAFGGAGDGFVTRFAVLPGVYISQEVTAVFEGGPTDLYGVVLNTPPSADVTITISADSQITVSPSTLVFTSANWNTPQIVTITAVDDASAESLRPQFHTGTLSHTASSSDADYNGTGMITVHNDNGVFATLNSPPILQTNQTTVRITDNDTVAITLDENSSSLNISETGPTSGSYFVSLNSIPTGNVTVSMSTDGQVTVNPTSLVFTPANWWQGQNVTVTAIDDNANESTLPATHPGVITHTVTSSDSAYNNVNVFHNANNLSVINNEMVARITDNDTPGVTLRRTTDNAVNGGLSVWEAGPSATYTAVLATQPSGDVTITINGGSQVTVSPSTIVFTSSNWNTPQTITATAIDDTVVEAVYPNRHTGTIQHTASSSDSAYNGITVSNIAVSITDNDTAGIALSRTSVNVNEAGPTFATYTVVLMSNPTSNVTVAVNPDSQITVAPTTLVFTPTNWFTPQTVTITAVDDGVDENGTHTGVVSHTSTSGDAVYQARTIANVTANISDNDVAGVFLFQSQNSTIVSEIGPTSDTYTVRLTSQPLAPVTITPDPGTQVTVSPTLLIFDASNWNIPQTVTVTAFDDRIDEASPHTFTLAHNATSTDPNYNATFGSIDVSITDNDTAGVLFTQTGGSTVVTEGGLPDTYTLELRSQPTAPVTITPVPGSQFAVSPASVVFTAADWNVPQTISLSALSDGMAEGIQTVALAHTLSSGDSFYASLVPATLSVTIFEPGVLLVPAGGSLDVTEGGATDTYTVRLTSQPASTVTIGIAADSQVAVGPTSLVFTPANWNVPQTVSVSATDDSVVEGPHSANIVNTVTSADPAYASLPSTTLPVSIADNDFPISVTPDGATLSILEGSSQLYTVTINTAPTAPVTLTLTPDPQTSVSTTQLVFTPDNWRDPQFVVVTAIGNDTPDGNRTVTVGRSIISDDVRFTNFGLPDLTVNIIDDDSSLILLGSESNDQFIVLFQSSSIQAVVNRKATFYSTDNYNQVLVIAGNGSNSIVLSNPSLPVTVLGGVGYDKVQIDGRSMGNVFAIDGDVITANGEDVALFQADDVTLNGKNGADVFTLVNQPTFALKLQGGSGLDRLTGTNSDSTWRIIGSNAGTINAGVSFNAIENLVGGSGNDTFIFGLAKSLSGTVDGGQGSNTLDYSAYRTPIVANLQTGAITGTRGFRNVTTLVGGLGADKLTGLDVSNVWNITGYNAGSVGNYSFRSFENLSGGNLDDAFVFADGQKLSGKIDGRGGIDALDYSAYTGSVTIDLQMKRATGLAGWLALEGFLGGAGEDALIGQNRTQTWSITGLGSGSITGGTSFANFENLRGGTLADTFDIATLGDWLGLLDGNAGTDTLVSTGGYVLTSTSSGTLNGRSFKSIETRR